MVGNLRDSNLSAADTTVFGGGVCRQGGTKIDLSIADQRLDRLRETSLYDAEAQGTGRYRAPRGAA